MAQERGEVVAIQMTKLDPLTMGVHVIPLQSMGFDHVRQWFIQIGLESEFLDYKAHTGLDGKVLADPELKLEDLEAELRLSSVRKTILRRRFQELQEKGFEVRSSVSIGHPRAPEVQRELVMQRAFVGLTTDDIVWHENLGSGAEGAIFKVSIRRIDDIHQGFQLPRFFTVKIFYDLLRGDSKSIRTTYEKEFRILSRLPYQSGIVRCHSMLTGSIPRAWLHEIPKEMQEQLKRHKQGQGKQCLWLIFDYHEGASLKAIVKELQPSDKIKIITDVAKSLIHLETHKVVHLDLHLGGILCNFKEHRLCTLLTDFSKARELSAQMTCAAYSDLGPGGNPEHIAPDLLRTYDELQKDGKSSRQYDYHKQEVFALGVLAFETLTNGRHPIPGYPTQFRSYESKQIQSDRNIPEALGLEIRDMLDPDPQKRPTLQEALNIFLSVDFSQFVSSPDPAVKELKDMKLVAGENSTSSKVKAILLGDMGVGKTCLFLRYTTGKWNFSHAPENTIGSDMRSLTFETRTKGLLQVQLWDTSGQERYDSLTQSHVQGAQAAFLCYDITSRESFNHLAKWWQMIEHKLGHQSCRVYVIGTKLDVVRETPERRQVVSADGIKFASRINALGAIEVSAKDNINVKDSFTNVLDSVADCNIVYHIPRDDINLQEPPKQSESCC